MNKVIVPHLFEIKTEVQNIYGFFFFELSNLTGRTFPPVKNNCPKPAKMYAYEMSNRINLPKKFEAMYRWYQLNDQKIYYKRPIVGNFSLKLMYDLLLNKLVVSPGYHHFVRFELGNIWPPGKILSNFIAYDLQKLGFGIFHGMALKFKNKVVCVFAPGANFKTPLLKALMDQGADYISGDKMIIKNGYVHFIPPLTSDKISLDYEKITIYKHKITDVFFVFRSKNVIYKNLSNINTINSYLNVFSMFNFLGTGWALNFRRMVDIDMFINDWYNFLGFKEIQNVKLIRQEKFKDLASLFFKELK